jgi:hypothetical protein
MHSHETTKHSSGTRFFVFVNFLVTIQALSAINKSLRRNTEQVYAPRSVSLTSLKTTVCNLWELFWIRLHLRQVMVEVKVKVKQSLYRPGQGPEGPRNLPESLGNGHMKVARLSAPRTGSLYPPGDTFDIHFDHSTIVRPEGSSQWKMPVTPSGIEPSISRPVSQCFNKLCHRVPPLKISIGWNSAILITALKFSETAWLCVMFLTDPAVCPLFPSIAWNVLFTMCSPVVRLIRSSSHWTLTSLTSRM